MRSYETVQCLLVSPDRCERFRSKGILSPMELYLVRHGQSEYNIGATDFLDSDLTEVGQKQAELTARRLQSAQLKRAFVSPLRRTLQTADYICNASDIRGEIVASICEYFSSDNVQYADFEGLSPDEIIKKYPWAYYGETFPCATTWWPEQLESRQMLIGRAERFRDALQRISLGEQESVIAISHADMLGRIMEAFLRQGYQEEPPFYQNCSITHLHVPVDPQKPAEVLTENDISHLPRALR